jgi:hypothetical protein
VLAGSGLYACAPGLLSTTKNLRGPAKHTQSRDGTLIKPQLSHRDTQDTIAVRLHHVQGSEVEAVNQALGRIL